ncbi:DUF418 domain-containing protein [Rossellomorea vietnamensis]|uniref:DUF418 domain-containing protein n=1 Tax=Rossellomorea vietnamensis TaxID=218284 RepID=A0A5D4NPP6_9BACI|nr:DUF418 domain-containing protein [Rossellomorea vietnamensis]TYS15870.1 DUF418 domain-containing protein [Rossellomorea vietnamensis]
MQVLQPVNKQERLLSLDVIRGFSLLGIFIINMISFHSPFLYVDHYSWWSSPADQQLFPWIDILVQSSFYPLFAMLFGYGLAMQQERSLEKGVNFYPLAVRRLLVLLLIGCVHAFLIWSGDILINYALFGLILLAFMKMSGKALLWTGALLFLLPQMFFSILLLLVSVTDPAGTAFYSDLTNITNSLEAYSSGSFKEIFLQRFEDWYNVNGPGNIIFLMLSILPMLMVGAGAGKLKVLERIPEHKKFWIVMLAVFASAGLILKSLPFTTHANIASAYIQDMLGAPFLSVSYAILLALLLINRKISTVLKPLAAAGRMSLTNYLAQSIIGTLIFYNYGLGLYGEVTLVTGTWLAAAIFLIGVILSELWLSKFRQGPMEKLWRVLTYKKEGAETSK